MVEFVAYDDEYDAGKARTGATKLIQEDGVKFIMMLGGDPWPGVEAVAEREGMLVSTLLPERPRRRRRRRWSRPARCTRSTTSPASSGWRRTGPELKTAVICAQDDALGKPSVATYLAAFEAAGIEVLGEPLLLRPGHHRLRAGDDPAALRATRDILCLDTCYADYVQPLCEQAFQQGYKGQIISCTVDYYERIVERPRRSSWKASSSSSRISTTRS